MTLAKAEIKIGTINQLGNQIDDALEEAAHLVDQAAGAASALRQAQKKLKGLYGHVDEDVDEGKMPDDPLLVAKYAKGYIQKAMGILDNLSTSADITRVRAEGKLEGLKASLGIAKSEMDAEKVKLVALRAAVEEGSVTIEDSGDIFDGCARGCTGRFAHGSLRLPASVSVSVSVGVAFAGPAFASPSSSSSTPR